MDDTYVELVAPIEKLQAMAITWEESEKANNLGITTPKLVLIIASLLDKSIQGNEKSSSTILAASKKDVVTVFDGSKAPTMKIRQYLERIYKYASCSPSCFVLAYIYIDRFIQATGLRLTSLNVHRLLITSLMVAAKFMDNECYVNAYYAKVGGVSTAEMNKLEMDFLFNLDFRLHVTVELYAKYCRQLEREGGGGRLQSSRLMSSVRLPLG